MKVEFSSQNAIQPTAQAEAPAKLQTATERREEARQDRVALSRQALEHIRQAQAERAAAQREKLAKSSDILSMIRDSNQQAEAQAESFAVVNRCQKIASNLMKGDRVPPKDLQYLMEHDAKLYQLAMSMRRIKKDPEDSDPVVKDEKKQAEGGSDASAPPESGAAPPEPAGAGSDSGGASGGAGAD